MRDSQDPIVLEMYTEVTRLKQVIRQIEGKEIPLPIPITLVSVMVAIVWEFIAFKWISFGDPIHKYGTIPFLLIVLISYFDPDNISPLGWVYIRVRRWIRPFRRVINRGVPQKGFVREYQQQTYIYWK
ncbi:hypothetical protein [Shimazuella kribbensis]|uniref:hypothetical protein n=1 Tax=Shimazuella kribbensis TaxID=139808 RepID=UPI00040450F1|nr:hypothetical protein [Shimazuella kribbensis]